MRSVSCRCFFDARCRRDEVFAAKRCGPFGLGGDHGWEDVAWRRDESENRLVRSGIAAEDGFRPDLASKARNASKAVGTTAKTTRIATAMRRNVSLSTRGFSAVRRMTAERSRNTMPGRK